MGYAYEWLTTADKNNIEQIDIRFGEYSIEMRLHIRDYWQFFEYLQDEEVGTSVVGRSQKKWIWSDKFFVDVACEDIHLLVVNQKLKLGKLSVLSQSILKYDQCVVDPIIAKVFETLSKSVASRSSPLQVNILNLAPSKTSEGWSVIRFLDQSELKDVNFSFLPRRELIELEDLLNWSEYSNTARIAFVFDELTTESLKECGKIAHRFCKTVVTFISHPSSIYEEFVSPDLFDIEIGKHFINVTPITQPLSQTTEIEPPPLEVSEKKNREPCLQELTNHVIMNELLKQLDWFDIQGLRKVCRGVRECIDVVKPEPDINAYIVTMDENEITSKIELKNSKFKRIKSKDWKTAAQDFHINLMHKNICLEELIINLQRRPDAVTQKEWEVLCDGFSSRLGDALQKRKTALKVKLFSISAYASREVMQLLPHIDKDSLKNISILYPSNTQRDIPDVPLWYMINVPVGKPRFEVEEMARTEQWKSASQLLIEHCMVTTPIREMNITHFANLNILVEFMSSDDIFSLKTELLKSSTLIKFRIQFTFNSIDETLYTLIGEPYRNIRDVKRIWYFRMPDPDYYLHIVLDGQDYSLQSKVVFAKVAKEDTPFY